MTQTMSETIPSDTSRRPRAPRWIGAAIIVVLIVGWFGYLRWVSGVLAHEEKYPNGKIKTAGFLKRTGWNDYKRHGLWTVYHPDGTKAAQGRFEMGNKADGWEYWDERGERIPNSAIRDFDK